MWCDNCLLLFPLRGGALVLSGFITIYSIVGGVLLFKYGQFVYFRYYEWDIFGAISMVCSFFWPSALIICSIRGIFMIVELNRGKSKIQWECDHGGYLYGANSDQYVGGSDPPFSTGICRYGVSGLYSAVVISVIVDLGFQVRILAALAVLPGQLFILCCLLHPPQMYMAFLNSRFSKRLLKYTGFVGPDGSGELAECFLSSGCCSCD
ncbi:hypothetical protein BS47DRAFT_1032307 [Hydnum rufescens UP504]|uniref:Uncharacterized protein n=1 Tax=Hydnum rufescens UP504 TaxID=1448309 RepID=A0A9P6DWG7_9AGAM|nr:hypothetical protein BS47DRAFT_1032307 [Hydnum rufescens UP504]